MQTRNLEHMFTCGMKEIGNKGWDVPKARSFRMGWRVLIIDAFEPSAQSIANKLKDAGYESLFLSLGDYKKIWNQILKDNSLAAIVFHHSDLISKSLLDAHKKLLDAENKRADKTQRILPSLIFIPQRIKTIDSKEFKQIQSLISDLVPQTKNKKLDNVNAVH